MKRLTLTPLQTRLLLMVLLAAVPALGLASYTFIEQRRQAAKETYADALRLARQAARDQDQLLFNARQVLLALAEHPGVRTPALGSCSELARNLIGPAFANVGAATANGTVFCTGLPLPGSVNIADRPYFRRAVASRDFAVGEYQIGRITGKPSINIGYPVLDTAGQVQAVVFVAVDLEWMNQLATQAQLPAGFTLTVLDANGIVLARYPNPERWIGGSVPDAPLLRAITASNGEGSATTRGLDGVLRLYGFTTLPSSSKPGSVYVTVGIPVESAFGPVERAFFRNLAGLGLLGVIVLIVGLAGSNLLILRPVNAVVAAATRLSAGDLGVRTGLPHHAGELGQLALAFDSMVASLQQREALLREAEARYRTLVEQSLVGVYLTTAERLLYVNEALLQIFGYEADEISGKGPLDLVHPDDRTLVERNLQERLRGDTEALRYTFRGRRKDGATIDCEVFGRRIEYDGQPAVLGTLIDITERKRAEEQVKRQLERITALRTIDLAITASLDLRVTLNVILDQVTTQLKVDAANVLLFNQTTQTLRPGLNRGFQTKALQHADLRLGQGYAGRAALEQRIIHVPNLPQAMDEFSRSLLLPEERFVAYHAVPLMAKGQVKGVLEIFHRSPLEPDPDWVTFLDALAGQAAIAVDNAGLFSDLQRANVDLTLAYDTTLEGWSKALDLRDKETEGHTQRVTDLTLRLARALGVRDEDLVHIRRGALLHDIGKMGIPDSILLKPGALTEAEWDIMRKHPIYAYELLYPIPYLRRGLDIPYCHHEKWDGTGYPRGLKGEQIPLAARIFAVVDVWDALTSDRPYRPAWPPDKTVAHIRAQVGKHFDPVVVETFLRILDPPR